MKIYSLISEDLSHLGGPMGSEQTSINFIRYFSSLERAKKAAENDYGTKHDPIEWKMTKNGDVWSSGDLGFVMYTIEPIKVE